MKRSLFNLISLLALSTLLQVSCSVATSAAPTATSAVLDTVPAISTHTPLPSTDTPQPTIQPTPAIFPKFLFPSGNSIEQQIGSYAPEALVNLPDAGKLLAASQVGDTALLLTEMGLQRVLVNEKQVTTVLNFNPPIMYGQLIPAKAIASIIYAAIKGDLSTPFAASTVIGAYQMSGTIHEITSFPQPVRILGLTPDNKGLYCLPVGQDMAFGNILIVDIEKGTITGDLFFRGYALASLAPDSRLLATVTRQPDSSGGMVSMIGIYDLFSSLPATSSRTFLLPLSPSHAGDFLWSSDSQKLYFLDLPGYEEYTTTSNGLWYLDVQTGKIEKIASVPDPAFFLKGISPDGEWILLMHQISPGEAFVIRLPDGKTQSFMIDIHALFVGWQ